jgi:hypothetical protein
MNSRISCSGRSAAVAMLMVLSAAVVLAQVNSLTVKGSFSGHGIGVFHGGTLQATATGAGAASQIGQFSYALNATVDSGGSSTGVFLLIFSNGDVIYGSFTGTGTPNGHIQEYLTINGGTGRFQGATGSLVFDRFVDPSTLPAFESHAGTVTGSISTPVK